MRGRFVGLAADVDASSRRTQVTVDAVIAGELARAAALDPVTVLRGPDGTDRYGAALPYAGRKVVHRRAGLDVVASPPKSDSVLQALGDHHVRPHVGLAHDFAVTEALSYLETHTAHSVGAVRLIAASQPLSDVSKVSDCHGAPRRPPSGHFTR